MTGCSQQVQTKNLDVLREAVINRSPSTPLLTVSNHKSCVDDPAIWSMYVHVHVCSTRDYGSCSSSYYSNIVLHICLSSHSLASHTHSRKKEWSGQTVYKLFG